MVKANTIGEVFELATPCGYAYLQHSHEHPEYKNLVRVLPGLFPEPHADLENLVTGPERFFVFFLVKLAAHDGFVTRVDRFDVPSHAQPFPTMRIELLTGGWAMVSNATDVIERVASLTPAQELMPRVQIWPQPVLRSRLATDWTWAHDAREQEGHPVSPCHDIGVAWPTLEDENELPLGIAEHYAYFADRPAAEEAARRLGSIGDDVVIAPAADESGRWLVRVTERLPTREDLEQALLRVSDELGGAYDGTERRLR